MKSTNEINSWLRQYKERQDALLNDLGMLQYYNTQLIEEKMRELVRINVTIRTLEDVLE